MNEQLKFVAIGASIIMFSLDFVLINSPLAISLGAVGLCLVIIGTIRN